MSMPLDDALQLLLADSDDHHPALADGLPTEAALGAKKPKKSRTTDIPDWDGPDRDPNDLPAQRWGVIAPQGSLGTRALEAVAPLIRLREAEQGAPAKIYRVPPEMDAKTAEHFRDEEYRAKDVPEDERPRYLLILGDLDRVSLDLQHVLANGSLVGRLAFTDATGDVDLGAYNAYAEKVVAWAKRPSPDEMPDAYFFTAQDGTPATTMASAQLVRPSLAEAERLRSRGKLLAASVVDPGKGPEDLLRAAAESRPAVLLSVSHGLGAPRAGWKDIERQRSLQGALAFGGQDVLSAREVVGKRFLPGGMWFCLACFGAGTPARSVYHTWLSELAKTGAYAGRLDAVLKSLPQQGGESPFVAALPQAALANPEGPLAVIGHMDLAWTYAFAGGKDLTQSYWPRIFSAIQALVNGSRASVGLDALMRFYRDATRDLHSRYQDQADARTWSRPDPVDPKELAHLWMLSNDLRGYVLLGDPAARLPLRRPGESPLQAAPSAPEIRSAPAPEMKPTAALAAPGAIPLATKVAAVRALLVGNETPRAVADQAGVSLPELWAWFDAYHAGGRERLDG